ncbi:hypothetical protein FWH30_00810 [Microgenomates group bacterium]|nr:hypothetical protein [Microgenomates group bacterium]
MHTYYLICRKNQVCEWDGQNYLWQIERWAKKDYYQAVEIKIVNESQCWLEVTLDMKGEAGREWLEKIDWWILNENAEVLVRESVAEATAAGKIDLVSLPKEEKRQLTIELKGREELADEVQGDKWEFGLELGAQLSGCEGEIEQEIATMVHLGDTMVMSDSTSPQLASREEHTLGAGSDGTVVATKSREEKAGSVDVYSLNRLPLEWTAWTMALGLLILIKLYRPKTRG